MRLQCAGQAVAQAALAGGAVVHSSILPERAHFIHHRNAEAAAHGERRQRIEHRRMGMQQIGPDLPCHLLNAPFQITHHRPFTQQRHLGVPACAQRGAEKVQAVNVLFRRTGTLLG